MDLERFCGATDPVHGTNCLDVPGHPDDHRSLSDRWSNENGLDAAATAIEASDQRNPHQGEPIEISVPAVHPMSIAADSRIDLDTEPHVTGVTLIDLNAAVEPTEVDWADGALRDLEVLMRPHERRVSVWRDDHDRWFRQAGHATLRTFRDGVERFTIHLYDGANLDDLKWFERVIQLAKEGGFSRHGWSAATFADGRHYWLFDGSRPYADPFVHRDPSRPVVPCLDSRCVRTWHHADGDSHVIDEFDGISVMRWQGPDGACDDYVVTVDVDEEMTTERAASFASDLAWATRSCVEANETVSDPFTKGMTHPAEYWRRRHVQEGGVDETAAEIDLGAPTAPPIGCPDHPNGRFNDCGPCGTARRRHDRWIAEAQLRERDA